MAFLRQWLLGVVSCAFLVSLLDQLRPPRKRAESSLRFFSGLVLILCMLPARDGRNRGLALDLDSRLSADRAALEEQYTAT